LTPPIDIEVVRAIADRVAVMQYGGIVERGGKEVVLSPSPRALYR
jgi:ABC-type oligopeptide transport system ATPase subunit